MMKWALRITVLLAILLVSAFLFFRTPDTDPAEMRAKYGRAPSQFIPIGDGLTVHLRDEATPDAKRVVGTIVLLHGSNSDLHTWQAWVARLKDDYRVIRFDQIGHGLTGPAPDGDYSNDAFVAQLDRVVGHLGLDRFVLAGNSMGGSIAMGYAMKHPEKLAGLVLVDAGGAPIRREEDEGGNIGFTVAATPVIRNLITQITPRSMIAASLSQSVSNQDIVTPEAVDRYWELLRYPGNRQATLERFSNGWHVFKPRDVAMTSVPTLVMWGEEDALIPFAAGQWYARTLPNATLVSYPGIGHLPMEEAPKRSVRDLRAWLESTVYRPRSAAPEPRPENEIGTG
ncbi:putative aminoacrylate hydrolase [Alteripontixanthobacter maritimus]|uniref:Putative aminoacrylate hydrolase n=1 Tax=Alteripontixanthobacter maritimus TaxID=2161824 RepID=A0A369QCW5_9SPHN|nr:alpha/beta hydrolase [Alteripontixanthobacter maritimus]RDC60759.1 putative aminoacrylate hydrolase [Alteripontixanthobacter maritimus]